MDFLKTLFYATGWALAFVFGLLNYWQRQEIKSLKSKIKKIERREEINAENARTMKRAVEHIAKIISDKRIEVEVQNDVREMFKGLINPESDDTDKEL